MFRDPYRCQECGAPVEECNRVEEFRFYIQEDVLSRRIRWYCGASPRATHSGGRMARSMARYSSQFPSSWKAIGTRP